MCVCVCLCVCMCMFVYTCVCVSVCVCMFVYTCVCVCVWLTVTVNKWVIAIICDGSTVDNTVGYRGRGKLGLYQHKPNSGGEVKWLRGSHPDIHQSMFHMSGVQGSILARPGLNAVLRLLVWQENRTECLGCKREAFWTRGRMHVNTNSAKRV